MLFFLYIWLYDDVMIVLFSLFILSRLNIFVYDMSTNAIHILGRWTSHLLHYKNQNEHFKQPQISLESWTISSWSSRIAANKKRKDVQLIKRWKGSQMINAIVGAWKLKDEIWCKIYIKMRRKEEPTF